MQSHGPAESFTHKIKSFMQSHGSVESFTHKIMMTLLTDRNQSPEPLYSSVIIIIPNINKV